MSEWCRENPWLTFFIVLAALGAVRGAGRAIWSITQPRNKRGGRDST
jgi:hypothetical protein